MIQEELTTISLSYFGEYDKTIRVYVPQHDENEIMPVIYMTDGQNLFEDGHPHQYGCWFTQKAVRSEKKSSGKSAIIVGIHNDEGVMRRTNELTPNSIGKIKDIEEISEEMKKLLSPEGERFDEFIVNTVMPHIEAIFPAEKGKAAFCGSSSGGLQSFFTVISHPDKFCIGGVFSPAFVFYDVNDILRFTADKMNENMPFLYIYSGAGDKLEKEICMSTEEVYDALTEFYPPDKMCEVILPEQRHHESAWEPIFRDFLHTFLERRDEF